MRAVILICTLLISMVAAAQNVDAELEASENIRGVFSFELSTNLSDDKNARPCGTNNDYFEGTLGERTRLFQLREPFRLNHCVPFNKVPSNYALDSTGSVSTYEGWIASIRTHSVAFNSWGECDEKHDAIAQILSDRYGPPLSFADESFYWAGNHEPMQYKHHSFVGRPTVWESTENGNAAILYHCGEKRGSKDLTWWQRLRGDSAKLEIQFRLIYESGLWYEAVGDWRDLMSKQRILESERSKPQL